MVSVQALRIERMDITVLHLGTTPIYGRFEKSLYDCQPLHFTVVRTSNQGNFVDMLTKLLTLAVTWRLFGPVGGKRIKTACLDSYTDSFRSSEKFH